VKPLDLLRAHWRIWGLDAPRFAWLAAAGLLILPLCVLVLLWWKVRRESKILEDATRKVEDLRAREPSGPTQALSAATCNDLARIFAKFPTLSQAWNAFASLFVMRRGGSGENQVWASESAETAFSEAAVLEGRLNRGFFSALPGIVTGTGLLFTFLAILVALLDVRITETSQIKGLDLLIEGLSGKFVSSIAALFSATIFLLTEKPLLHRLTKARLKLVASIDAFVPRLSSARILAELQRDMAEQSSAFRSFNEGLPGKLKQGFSEGMGPTIQRMVDAIEELNRQLRAAEAQKQESIKDSLSGLLQNLEASIASSLHSMGDRFKESLSGAAVSQFAQLTNSLGGAARVLENMNAQFQGTQSALSELVNMAKKSTAEQLALGKSQVEDLTVALSQFMQQMNETAGSSVSHMATALTAVVHELSCKVNDLVAQMAATLQKNAEQTTNAAAVVVERADRWSSRSAEQVDQLVRQLETHTGATKEVESALMSAVRLFNDSLSQYASLNAGLQEIANQVSAMVTASAGAVRSTTENQHALQQISAQANQSQQDAWDGIRASMEQYKAAFSETERAATDLLAQIAQNVNSHLELTRRGYEQLVSIADDHFAQATQRLGTSVDQLDEHLQDLTESLERLKGRTDGIRA
jgi:hypothetical protein